MNAMLRLLVALAAGALFGFGLSLSGMVDPARVIGFLDVASGHWDPSLAFVLGGTENERSVDDARRWQMKTIVQRGPRQLALERHAGKRDQQCAAIFGAGWGLAGFCPGPAVASLSVGLVPSFIFAAAMVAGMMLHDHLLAGHVR
jgi:hypothetical protein